MPDTVDTSLILATPRRETRHVTCEQFIFRSGKTARYNLGTVINALWVDGRWTGTEQRDRAEALLRSGVPMETKVARYTVIPEHVEVAP